MVLATVPPAGTEVDPGTLVDMKTGEEVVNDRTGDTASPATIFEDNFSNPSRGLSGLLIVHSRLQGDGLRVYEARDYTSSIVFGKACASRDVIVEVDAKAIRGKPEDTSMGVVCRAGTWDSEYYLGIRPDGYAMITKMLSDSQTVTLIAGYHRGAIGRSGPTVHVRGECIGDKLALYVNGQKVEEATDSELGYYGWVGLFVGNEAEAPPRADVSFDDFVVRLP